LLKAPGIFSINSCISYSKQSFGIHAKHPNRKWFVSWSAKNFRAGRQNQNADKLNICNLDTNSA
ncbi:hypothetical protein, partial [Kingella kingae]|uniref:hypothetical protein n=1 Tax=Kingella kingae TaxID=504 RepID=UPI001FCBF2AA